jgi:hypothetical protein
MSRPHTLAHAYAGGGRGARYAVFLSPFFAFFTTPFCIAPATPRFTPPLPLDAAPFPAAAAPAGAATGLGAGLTWPVPFAATTALPPIFAAPATFPVAAAAAAPPLPFPTPAGLALLAGAPGKPAAAAPASLGSNSARRCSCCFSLGALDCPAAVSAVSRSAVARSAPKAAAAPSPNTSRRPSTAWQAALTAWAWR